MMLANQPQNITEYPVLVTENHSATLYCLIMPAKQLVTGYPVIMQANHPAKENASKPINKQAWISCYNASKPLDILL